MKGGKCDSDQLPWTVGTNGKTLLDWVMLSVFCVSAITFFTGSKIFQREINASPLMSDYENNGSWVIKISPEIGCRHDQQSLRVWHLVRPPFKRLWSWNFAASETMSSHLDQDCLCVHLAVCFPSWTNIRSLKMHLGQGLLACFVGHINLTKWIHLSLILFILFFASLIELLKISRQA